MIGMDPCGVVFAFLRSCYTTKARLLHGSDRQSTVKWYFAPTGAKYFEGMNCMQPLSWSGGSPAGNTQGEVIGAPRPYSKGVTPTCAQGTTYWGQKKWFNDGVPSLSGPWVPNACGLPSACPGPSCQPWYTTSHGFPLRAMHSASPSLTWLRMNVNANFTYWTTSSPAFIEIYAENETPVMCGSLPASLVGMICPTYCSPGNFLLKLVAYDAATFTGTYVIPSTVTVNPILAGFTLFLTLPA